MPHPNQIKLPPDKPFPEQRFFRRSDQVGKPRDSRLQRQGCLQSSKLRWRIPALAQIALHQFQYLLLKNGSANVDSGRSNAHHPGQYRLPLAFKERLGQGIRASFRGFSDALPIFRPERAMAFYQLLLRLFRSPDICFQFLVAIAGRTDVTRFLCYLASLLYISLPGSTLRLWKKARFMGRVCSLFLFGCRTFPAE